MQYNINGATGMAVNIEVVTNSINIDLNKDIDKIEEIKEEGGMCSIRLT